MLEPPPPNALVDAMLALAWLWLLLLDRSARPPALLDLPCRCRLCSLLAGARIGRFDSSLVAVRFFCLDIPICHHHQLKHGIIHQPRLQLLLPFSHRRRPLPRPPSRERAHLSQPSTPSLITIVVAASAIRARRTTTSLLRRPPAIHPQPDCDDIHDHDASQGRLA